MDAKGTPGPVRVGTVAELGFYTNAELNELYAGKHVTPVAVAAGALVGVPLGIALGRYLWDLFARQISVIPEPSVPVLIVVLVIAGALMAANLVAAVPGRAAARIPAAALLRTE